MHFVSTQAWNPIWSTRVDWHGSGWVNVICVLTGEEGVWSTQVEIHVFPRCHGRGLVNMCCDGFSVRAGIGGFRQHKLRYVLMGFVLFSILCLRRHSGQDMLLCISFLGWHGRRLFNARWDSFCVYAVSGWAWSIHVEIHFVSWLAKEGFAQHILWCIL